ncbi:MAG: hypothetical protein R3C05_18525 [Pirellulaceae bacterium]
MRPTTKRIPTSRRSRIAGRRDDEHRWPATPSIPPHGDPEGKGHDAGFKVVGVLAPTGTPNDRATFVNMEGFYLMEGHAKPPVLDDETTEETSEVVEVQVADDGTEKPLPLDQRKSPRFCCVLPR